MTAEYAQVAYIHDGDTIRLKTGERIRLAAIDAPELRGSPSCRREKRSRHWCNYKLGIRSRDALRAFVVRGRVRIERTGVDFYGRTLAKVTVNGVDAGSYLVSRGLARWLR